MSTKKFKGQKVDPALFMGSAETANLPSAPDPNRESTGGRGYGRGSGGSRSEGPDRWGKESQGGGFGDRRGGDRDYGNRGGFSGGGAADSDEPWSRGKGASRGFRSNRDSDRGFGDRDSGRGFSGRGFGDREESRGFGGDRSERGFESDRGGRGFGGDRGFGEPTRPRPEEYKLKLEPRGAPMNDSVAPPAPPANQDSRGPSAPADKWDNVFKKSERPSEPDRGFIRPSERRRGREEEFDRRSGGGRGFGERDSREGGFHSNSGDFRRRTNPYEEISDPRFAGKFGSRGQSAPQQQQQYAGSESSLTAAVSAVANSVQAAEQKKAEEAKAAKEAAKLAKEIERLALEEKKKVEKEAEEAEHARLMVLAAAGKESATQLFNSGKKGSELLGQLDSMTDKPTGAGLLSCILEDKARGPNPRVWFSKAEYGPALASLLKGAEITMQVLALLEVERYCGENNFPMYSPGAGKNDLNLIEVIFQAMLETELADPDAFNAWVDEEKKATKFRTKALVKTVGFMTWLNEEEEPDSDEEDFEVDAVRPTVP